MIYKIYRQGVAFIVSLMVLASLSMGVVSAQSGSIGGKPANPEPDNLRSKSIFIETLAPGQTKTDTLQVINNTNDTKVVTLYGVDAVSSSGGAFACAQAADTRSEVGSWITLSQSSVTLDGGQSQNVPFTVTAPDNASPGEHNGCVVMQEEKATTFKEGIGISFRTAIRVAVLVPGEVKKSLTLNPLGVSRANGQLVLHPSVTNSGNVSVDATIKPSLSTLFGTTIATQTNTFPVLRDQTADWNFEFEKPFWGGFYRAAYAVSYDASNNGVIGLKSAQSPTEVDGPSKLVFVAPAWQALLVELLVFGGVVAAIILVVRRRHQKNSIARSWTNYSVKKSEHLRDIAAAHDISWKTLARANNIKAPYHLKTGQTIKVPKQSAKKS